jgi:hypothetical protein
MPWKDPQTAGLWPLIQAFGLAMLGGAVNLFGRMRSDASIARMRWYTVVGDVLTSGFVGICVFFLSQHMGLAPWLEAFCIAVFGHMGARGMGIMTRLAAEFFQVDGKNRERKK